MAPAAASKRVWLNTFELAARHPWLGTAMGLVLVVLLVPMLDLAGGSSGSLGPSIPLFFLVPMLLASTLGGRTAGVIVAVAAVFAWDWFFIPPVHTVTIYSARDLLALVIFLLDALLTSELATLARQRAEDALQRARTSEALYDLSVALIGRHDLDAILPALAQRLLETFDLEACAIVLRAEDAGAWKQAAVAGKLPDDLDVEKSRSVAGILSWVGSSGQMCGLGRTAGPAPPEDHGNRQTRPERRADFWPLRVGTGVAGALELVYKRGTGIDPQRDHLLTTLVNGATIALEQERLFKEERAAVLARESDRLKSALLSSVSHDLRTPLAGIKAATSSLLQTDVNWSEEDRRAFLVDIDSEADRLARLVSNLLDLSRIEAGAISPNRDWEDVGELIDRVARRHRSRFPDRHIDVHIEGHLPPVRLDTIHIEQALTNLIENAAKYSPEGSPIAVRAAVLGSEDGAPELHISVNDRGMGIPPSEQQHIFEKFYRVAGSRGRAPGTGMGLAIVKGLVEAGGGRVNLVSEPGKGSTFTVVLPMETLPNGEAVPPVPATHQEPRG